MTKKKRLDGIVKLSKEEAKNRDARAQYWMNQRKIERVAEGAARHGWQRWPIAVLDTLTARNYSTPTMWAGVDEYGDLVITVKDDGRYVLVEEDRSYALVRKIESFRVSAEQPS